MRARLRPAVPGTAPGMGDYEQSTMVTAPVDEVFDYLSRVENLPRYMDRMTEAHSVAGEAVSVEARLDEGDVGSDVGVDGGDGERTVRGEAWFRIDAERRRLEWGAEGPHDYRGELDVAEAEGGSRVTVKLHTTHDAPGIEDGIDQTLANIRRLSTTG